MDALSFPEMLSDGCSSMISNIIFVINCKLVHHVLVFTLYFQPGSLHLPLSLPCITWLQPSKFCMLKQWWWYFKNQTFIKLFHLKQLHFILHNQHHFIQLKIILIIEYYNEKENINRNKFMFLEVLRNTFCSLLFLD